MRGFSHSQSASLSVLGRLLAQTETERLLTPLARFEAANGDQTAFASDWAFPIPDCFMETIDLRPEPASTRSRRLVLKQGSRFAFDVGHVVYDTALAYLAWSEALRHVNRAFQVLEALPASPARIEKRVFAARPSDGDIASILAEMGENVAGHGLKHEKKDGWVLRVSVKRSPGHVRLNELTPAPDRGGLAAARELTLTQDAFVRLLITGKEP